MAREKFQTLTEQMFYVLISLQKESCGMDIMNTVQEMTEGRVTVGPGTLYHLLDEFVHAGMIRQTKAEGRKKSYLITEEGRTLLTEETMRLRKMICDYETFSL